MIIDIFHISTAFALGLLTHYRCDHFAHFWYVIKLPLPADWSYFTPKPARIVVYLFAFFSCPSFFKIFSVFILLLELTLIFPGVRCRAFLLLLLLLLLCYSCIKMWVLLETELLRQMDTIQGGSEGTDCGLRILEVPAVISSSLKTSWRQKLVLWTPSVALP